MKAEDEYLRALQSVDRARISDGRLVLSDGGARLTFRRLDPAATLPGEWSVVGVATNDALASPPAGVTPTVTFNGDETLALTAGCNTGAGSWQVDGEAIAVDPIRLTTKHCDQPQGAMEQEAAIASALEAASRIEITPTQLTLVDPQGSITLVAARPAHGS